MQKLIAFIRKDTVLSVAAVLAVLSMPVIPPDRAYIGYIDFRTLGLLFCLMTISSGVRRTGFFTYLAGRMTAGSRSVSGTVTMLVLVSFFLVVLQRGAGEVSTNFGLNSSFSDILTGILLFFIIGCEFFIQYRIHINGNHPIPTLCKRIGRWCSATFRKLFKKSETTQESEEV